MNSSRSKYLKKALSSTVSTLSSFAIAASPLMSARLSAADLLPTGGQVESGSATINSPTPNIMQIDQSSDRAIIGWDGFSIGAGNQVLFNVPNANSATLNRVNGSTTSTIAGQMRSNGQLYLINPNGILITPTGSVRTNAFIGSSLDISNSDFLSGKTRFKGKGNSADVINQGEITTEDGGVAVLMGGHVENSGSITANEGAVGLASGEDITVDLTGDGLLSVSVPTSSANQTRALIAQTGRIKANGGRVELKAAATAAVPSAAINVSGDIEANSVEQTSDGVSFGGDGLAPAPKPAQRIRKAQKQGTAGTIVVDGGAGKTVIDKATVSAISKSGKGGQIAVTGREVVVSAARLAASGNLGGGKIEVGGSFQGKGPVANAETTTVDAFTVIDVSATDNGNGGEAVVWADNRTAFSGSVTATGGVNGGDGGNVEVSGKAQLAYLGTVNTLAPKGKTGNLLLDPYNVTISSGADTNQSGFTATGSGSTINVTTLTNALATSNVTVSTGSSGAEAGDISVNNAITWSANTTLTLTAAGAITLNATITNTGATSGLTLNSSGTGGINAGSLANSGTLTFNVANASAIATIYGAISGAGSVIKTGSGTLRYIGSMSYTGTTNINGGTLNLVSGIAVGVMPVINVNNGGTLGFNINDTWGQTNTTSSSAIFINAGGMVSSNGFYTTIWNLTLNGGTLNANGGVMSTYGSFQLAGTVTVTGSSQIIASGTNSQINLGGNGSPTTTFNVVNASDSLTVAPVFQSGSALTKTGAGTLTLTAANTYTGTTTISAGTLQVGNGGTTGSLGTGSVINNANLVYNFGTSKSLTLPSSTAYSGSGNLTATAGNIYFGGNLSLGTGALSLTATSTSDLGGPSAVDSNIIAGSVTIAGMYLAPPSNTKTLTFNTSASNGAINITDFMLGKASVQFSYNNVAFNAGTGTITVAGTNTLNWWNTGATLTLTGNIAGSGSIGQAGAPGSNMTINMVTPTGINSTYSGVISGANIQVTKNGAGTMTMTGANTYSGTTTVSAGTLQIGNGGTTGSLGTGNIVNNAALVFNRSDAISVAGVISGTGTLTQSGTGITTLTGTNAYTGTTSINGGTLTIANYTASGGIPTISVNNGGTLAFGTNDIWGTATSTSSVAITINSGGTVKSNGYFNTLWNLTLNGGTLNANGGVVTSWGSFGLAGTVTVTGSSQIIASGANSQINLGSYSITTTTFNIVNASDSLSVAAVLQDTDGNASRSAALTKTGAGTLTLTAANTYTGATTVSAGTLQVGNGGTTGTLGSGSIVNNGALVFNRSDALSVAGVVSGTGTLTQSGAGTTTLTGANTYSGTTTISAGTLQVGNGGTTGTLGTGSVTNNAALVFNRTDAISVANVISGTGALTQSGTGTTTLTAANTYSGATTVSAGTLALTNTTGSSGFAVSSGATLQVGSASDYTFNPNANSSISGAGTLKKVGAGTLTFASGNSTFTWAMAAGGLIDVQAGVLIGGTFASDIWTSNLSHLNVAAGATFSSAEANARVDQITGAGTIKSGYVGYGYTAMTIGVNNGSSTFTGTIADTGTGNAAMIVKAGTGTITLSGTNTYTGTTTITGGTLQIGNGGTTGSLGTGAIINNAALVFNRSDALSVAGVVSGTGTLTQSGTGTTTLFAANTYSGATTVSAGTLALTNTTTSSGFAVSSGATLQVGSASDYTFNPNANSSISGAGTLKKVGTGNLTFGGANFFTWAMAAGGLIDVQAGLLLGGTNVKDIWTTNLSNLNVASGATFAGAEANVRVDQISGSGTISSGYNGAGYTAMTIGVNNGSSTFGGAITDTASGHVANIVKIGSGTLTLTGANTYGGTTTVNAGTLQIGNGGTAGTLGTGSVTNNAALVFNRSDALSVANAISGTGTLSQIGTGTTTLTGANTYSGTTTVNAGTLTLSGSWNRGTGTATTVVATGATLNGAGVVTAATLAHSGAGTLALSGSNLIDALSTTGTTGSVSLKNAKSLSVGSISATSIALQTTGATSDLTLGSGAALAASGTGTAVVLAAGRNFINNAGAGAITLSGTGGPNWQVYAASSVGNTYNNLDSGNAPVWGKTYGQTVSDTGNRYIFANVPTVTFTSVNDTKIYGNDATTALQADYTISGLGAVTGAYLATSSATAFTGAPVLTSSGAGVAANAGTYAINVAAGTLTAQNGFTLAYANSGVLTVNARPITVTADAKTMVYGNAVPTLTQSVTSGSLVNGDTLTGALATTASSTSNVGAYGITQGTLAASANYALTYVGANVTVGQRAITVTADAKTINFGVAIPTLTYVVGGAGLVNGDTLSGALTTPATNGSNTGTYAINQGTLASSGNYAMTFAGNTLTIQPGTLTITANGLTMLYGNAVPTLTYTVTGATLQANEFITGSLATLATSTSGVGTYAITQGTLAGPANYALTFVAGSLTINQRPITITADAKTMIYGDAVPSLSYVIGGSGLVNSDTLSGALATTASSTSNVGTYGITQGTVAASANYAITYVGNNVTVGTRAITVTADAKTMTYGNSTPTLTYTVGGLGLVNGDTLAGALATTASSTSNVGTYGITQGTVAASGNYAVSYVGNNVTVGTRAITVTADATTMTYGNSTPTLTYTVGGLGLVNGDSLSGALATTASSTSNVGTYGITQGTVAASANYALTYAGNNVTVGQRAITVTADAKTMIYGDSTPTLTYTVGGLGLVNGDTLTGALATTANATSNVGTYGITQGSVAASANYALTYVGGNVTVGQRAITVTADAKTMIYGNSVPTLTYAVGGLGLVNGDTLSGALATSASSTSNVGDYGITQGTVAASANYALTYAGNNVTVGQRAINVTADAKTMIYGNATPALTYAVGGLGLVNGDTLTGALATTASSTSNVGAYGIAQGTVAASANYEITYVGNNVTVGTRAITVTADAKTMVYGNSTPTLTYAIGDMGLVNGDTLTGALATTANSTSNVGTYGITQGTVAASANYALTYVGNTVTVDQRAITVTADAKTMIYGDSVPSLSYTVGDMGLVNGDTLTGALATTANATSNVGTYGITQGTAAASANYALTYVGGNVTIGQRAITVTADAKTMIYGNSVPTLTYTVGNLGLVNGDTLSGALATSATSASGIGTYAISQGTVAASANYALTYVGGNVTVTPRALTITADAKSMIYGNAVPDLTYVIGGDGLVNGDQLTGALATTASSTSNVGAYGITQGTVAASANYALTYVGSNVTITPRALTITADAKSMVYGNAVPQLTYSTGGLGLVNGDQVTGSLATTASPTANVGTYAITQGSVAASSNYAVTYQGADVTINKRTITVAADAQSMIYGNSVPTLTYTVGGMGLVNGDTLSGGLATLASSTANVGSYGITQGTLEASGNYDITGFTGNTVTIAKRSITVTADSQVMAYGDAVPTLSYTVGGMGLVNNDILTGALATAATSSSNVGTYAITRGTLADTGNYDVTQFTGSSLTINRRAITLTADAQSMTYGNVLPTLTYTIGGAGLVNSDALSGALATTASSSSNIGTYAITQGTLAASDNYEVTSFTDGALSIGKRAITIAANGQTMTYGNAVPILTYVVGGDGLAGTDALTGALATTAGPTSSVGNYAITRGTLAASANYDVTYTGNSVSVTPRPLTITADAKTMVYGNTVPGLTYQIGGGGLVNGDTLSGALSSAVTATSNVGTYAIGVGTVGASGNYAVTYVGNDVTVAPRPVTVSAHAKTITYGNGVPTLTFTIGGDGLLIGDTVTGSLATTASSTSNVGAYAITRGNLAFSSNYDVSYTGNTLTVNPRPITVTAVAKTMTYGNAVPALTYTVGGSGLVNNDTLSGGLATTASSTSNVGTYGITQGTLTASSNYTVSYTGANVTVAKRILTVAADSQSMIYGDAVPTLTYSYCACNLVNGDTLSGSLASTASSTANVGTYAITQGSLAASSNYTLSFVGNNVTIGHRQITVIADTKTMSYGDAVPTLTYTVGGAGLVNNDTLTGALAAVATNTSGTGTYAINRGTLAAPLNYAMTFTGSNIVVGKRSVILSADAKTVTYGNAIPTLTVTVGGAGLANASDLTGALDTAARTGSNVGRYVITQGTLSLPSSNYDVTYQSNDVNIVPRQIFVAANAQTMTYGDAVPNLTYTITDGTFLNSDGLSGGLSTAASSHSSVGNYSIDRGSLTTSPNYEIVYQSNSVAVQPRAITVSADAKSMTYGNVVPALTYVVGGRGLANGDQLTGALSVNATSLSAVGDHSINQGSLAASSNYAVTYVGNTMTINKRAITIAANAQTMTYGNALPTLTYTVGGAGLVAGDQLSGALATAATSTSNIGAYGITIGSLAASPNYDITYSGNNLTIGQRTITIRADAKTMTYGDALPNLTYTIGGQGLAGSDVLTGALSTAAVSTSNIGSYSISQGTLSASSNYAVSYVGDAVTIGKRALTITADAKTMTYGDALPTLTYTLGGQGLVSGDALSGAMVTTAGPSSHVGGYAIGQGSLAASSNYAVTFVGNNVTIGQRSITIAANSKSMTYGDSLPTLTYVVGGRGLVGSDALTGTLATAASSTSNVGTYSIDRGSLSASTDYAVTYVGNTITVGQRTITITANSKTMSYGDAVPTLTYVVGGSGLAGTDTLSGALASTVSSTSNVGTYDITRGTLAATANYNLVFNSGVINVGRRAITVAADNKTIVSGSALPPLTYSFTSGNVVNGDLLNGALATSANASSPVGLYTIGQGSLSASSNYDLTFVTGALTISAVGNQPSDVTVNIPAASQALQTSPEPPVAAAALPEIKIETASCSSTGDSAGDFVDLVSGMSVAGQMGLGGCSAAN